MSHVLIPYHHLHCARHVNVNLRLEFDRLEKFSRNLFLTSLLLTGRNAYAPSLNYISSDDEAHFVKDFYFMSYHTTVITSK
ncbi:CLUMA_CG010123, isoform A [Clunio marinus]|uniref:CLUMA_CG010123, isoform A n=1 Tax=Clunio marinus TaxID=568069 RepID=A0A1J1IAP1_9DIPT|nr:CLUMA_CG010123, isoform A [Clunio marinus]